MRFRVDGKFRVMKLQGFRDTSFQGLGVNPKP